jgi:OmpA-OmpF porin, OOP family
MRIWLLTAAVCLLAASATAQTDVKGSKDHPLFARVPGYYIESYDAQDSFPAEISTHPRTQVVGHFWKIMYSLSADAKNVDPIDIANRYADIVTRRGGTLVVDEVDDSGGTTVAEMVVDGKHVWLQVSVSSAGGVYDLTIVEETPKSAQPERR